METCLWNIFGRLGGDQLTGGITLTVGDEVTGGDELTERGPDFSPTIAAPACNLAGPDLFSFS